MIRVINGNGMEDMSGLSKEKLQKYNCKNGNVRQVKAETHWVVGEIVWV